ncbi:MAG TPA: integrase arm-type DNA-binding domain-containing protein [Gammaproteobacteria bacterium]|nr:integrase arm-type DNA-binding domain-containing protein [Gammaproteobacteria bacterium]
MLDDATIKAAKPRERPFKLYDGEGLYLLVAPHGAKGWRFRYTFGGREKLLSFGVYPDVSLKRAREKRRETRVMLDRRIDPSAVRRAQREAERATQSDDAAALEYLALEYLSLQAGKPPPQTRDHKPIPLAQLRQHLEERLTELAAENRAGAARANTLTKMRRRLERYVFPYLGARPVADKRPSGESEAITAQDIIAVLRRIEQTGSNETAHRTLAAIRRVLRYAVAVGRATHDVSTFETRLVLAAREEHGFAAITDPARLGELLRAIDGYRGEPTTMAALKLLPLVFVRPGELRAAEWREFDLEATVDVGKKTEPAPAWSLPGERMKMGAPHVVPLSRQAAVILEELRPITGNGRYVFPSVRDRDRYISDNTMTSALRRLEFAAEEVVPHGFRHTASTLLHELGFAPELIETQLAHKRPGVAGKYNRSHLLPQRRAMLQQWADYLDQLRAGERKVTAIGSRRANTRRRARG